MKSFDGFDSGPVNELKPGHYLSNDGVFQYYKIPETKYVTDTIETVAMKVRELLDAFSEEKSSDRSANCSFPELKDSTARSFICFAPNIIIM
ncbi:MAG: hypothetical protein R3A12_01585 [Ignavibacteria bacterium]